MKTIFVTGGAGFIGSCFIEQLVNNPQVSTVINFDLLTYAGNTDNVDSLLKDSEHRQKYTFVRGDIRDAEAVLAALPQDCDAIFNFAAESHVDRSIESANDFVTTNVLGTQVLLDCARERNVVRFVQISTDEVMGSVEEGEFFTEDSAIAPNSPYAASKAAAEHFVRAAGETFGVDFVITRCGNNYGPRQYPEKLIPVMINKALADDFLPVYGDGMNVRDWIHVEDHCEAIWLAYEKAARGSIYNIGSRNPLENLDVVKTILDTLDKPHSLIKSVTDRLGHDRRYAIDPTKIETDLGWHPKKSWEEGIRETIDWYRNQK